MSERSRVPLPEVSQFTDDIEFLALGLPVGFDNERLLVNLDGIDRVRRVAGLRQLTILRTVPELHDEWNYSVSGVDGSGALTGVAVKEVANRVAPKSTVYFPSGDSSIGLADAVVKIDGDGVQARIDKAKTPRRDFDPRVIGKALNAELKIALNGASKEANLSREKLIQSLGEYGLWIGIMEASSGVGFIAESAPALEILAVEAGTAAFITGVLGIFMYGKSAVEIPLMYFIDRVLRKDPDALLTRELVDQVAHGRKSLFVGAAPDRHLATKGLLSVSSLIRARA